MTSGLKVGREKAPLKVGVPALLITPEIKDGVPGRITVVSPATDPNSTTVEIWAQAANPGSRLRPGTSVSLSIVARTVEQALVVPSSAVVNQPDGGKAVMVVGPDNRAHVQPVQIGIQNDTEVEILSGVKVNQKVITAGAYGLPDNTQVKIESSSEPAKTEAGKTTSD